MERSGLEMPSSMSQRGPDDAYRYKFVEPDTGCVLGFHMASLTQLANPAALVYD